MRRLVGGRRGSRHASGLLASLQGLQKGVVHGFDIGYPGGQRWNGIGAMGYETWYRDISLLLLLPRSTHSCRVSRRLSCPAGTNTSCSTTLTGLSGQTRTNDRSVLLCSKEWIVLNVCRPGTNPSSAPPPPPGPSPPTSPGSPRGETFPWRKKKRSTDIPPVRM